MLLGLLPLLLLYLLRLHLGLEEMETLSLEELEALEVLGLEELEALVLEELEALVLEELEAFLFLGLEELEALVGTRGLEGLEDAWNVVLAAAPSVFVSPGKPPLPGIFPPFGHSQHQSGGNGCGQGEWRLALLS